MNNSLAFYFVYTIQCKTGWRLDMLINDVLIYTIFFFVKKTMKIRCFALDCLLKDLKVILLIENFAISLRDEFSVVFNLIFLLIFFPVEKNKEINLSTSRIDKKHIYYTFRAQIDRFISQTHGNFKAHILHIKYRHYLTNTKNKYIYCQK